MTFIESLEPAEAKALREAGGVRNFDPGEALLHERQVPDSVMVVDSGRVKVVSATREGREVVLAVRSAGDLIGEHSIFDGTPRSSSAIAIDRVEALVLRSVAFEGFLGRNPRVALALLKLISGRLRESDRKRIEYSAHDAGGRVASRLIELVDRFGREVGDGTRIDLPLTQEDLAGWTGVSVESVSKTTRSMRDLGWIRTGRRQITVLDIAARCASARSR